MQNQKLRIRIVWILGLFCLFAIGMVVQGFAQEEEPFKPQVQVIEEGDLSEVDDYPPKRPKSNLAWLYDSLGLRYTLLFAGYYLAACAALILAIVTWVCRFNAPALDLERIRAEMEAGRADSALKVLRARKTYLRRLLDAASAHPGPGASSVMQRHAAWEEASAHTNLSFLLLVGVLAFFSGCYGALEGMAQVYSVISISDYLPRPSELASANSMALVTILVGQNLTWFCLLAWWILRILCVRQSAYVHKTAEELLSLFQSGGQPKAG